MNIHILTKPAATEDYNPADLKQCIKRDYTEMNLAECSADKFRMNALSVCEELSVQAVYDLVLEGPLEAMSFCDMCRQEIAALRGKLAIYDTALGRVEVAFPLAELELRVEAEYSDRRIG